jgi:hypothetical protein
MRPAKPAEPTGAETGSGPRLDAPTHRYHQLQSGETHVLTHVLRPHKHVRVRTQAVFSGGALIRRHPPRRLKTHSRTHAHTHTRTHEHTHTRTHAHTSLIHQDWRRTDCKIDHAHNMPCHAQAHSHTHTHTLSHSHTHAHARTHTNTHRLSFQDALSSGARATASAYSAHQAAQAQLKARDPVAYAKAPRAPLPPMGSDEFEGLAAAAVEGLGDEDVAQVRG